VRKICLCCTDFTGGMHACSCLTVCIHTHTNTCKYVRLYARKNLALKIRKRRCATHICISDFCFLSTDVSANRVWPLLSGHMLELRRGVRRIGSAAVWNASAKHAHDIRQAMNALPSIASIFESQVCHEIIISIKVD